MELTARFLSRRQFAFTVGIFDVAFGHGEAPQARER
jgi:hypothetical protein